MRVKFYLPEPHVGNNRVEWWKYSEVQPKPGRWVGIHWEKLHGEDGPWTATYWTYGNRTHKWWEDFNDDDDDSSSSQSSSSSVRSAPY